MKARCPALQMLWLRFYLRCKRILLIDNLEERKTITGEYYALGEIITNEENHLPSGQCTSLKRYFGNGKIKAFKIRVVHLIRLSTFYCLFPNLKKCETGKRFGSNREMTAAV